MLLDATVYSSFMVHFFSAWNTAAVDNFVCITMRDSCPDVWAYNDLVGIGDCEAKLAALPLFQPRLLEGEESYIDGNT